MNVAVIDADLIGRAGHRFPNLACMKISAYWKTKGANVELKLDYKDLDLFDQVFISKVFSDTPIPENIKETETIHLGGTGFYFDKAPNLPYEIEHIMPDYHLYDNWVEAQKQKERELAIKKGKKPNEKNIDNKYSEYTDYSIGFLTRGCFRKCKFCVNQKYDKVEIHSPLEEFYDPSRKKICLLDDNFFGCPKWSELLDQLIDTGKRFKFKQGLDERMLNAEKCKKLFSVKYDNFITFAFDNIGDYDLIESKLKLIKKYRNSKDITFYVLVGFESTDITDIEGAFKRIHLLMQYQCIPFVMKYRGEHEAPFEKSEYRGMYITLARWCNQASMFKTKSLREYAYTCQKDIKSNNDCSAVRYLKEFESKHPDIAARYFDIKYSDYKEGK